MTANAFPVPTPEEVIALCEKLQARNALRRRNRSLVSFALIAGMIIGVIGLFALIGRSNSPGMLVLGLSLIASGTIGVIYLAMPPELMKIARRLQLSPDPNVIPPLLDTLALALQVANNGNTIRQLRRTLAALLLRLSADDSVVLTPENWDAIYRHLSSHNVLHLVIDGDDLAFTLAILDLLRRRRDTRYIATIKSMSYGLGAKWKQLQAATKECLIVLEEQKRKEDESKVLLRASQPKTGSDTLLRPAGYSSDTQAQELLRANSVQES